ncbi:MAG: hypothetical protein JWO90_1374 [Solirubrobacterales bacterium]|nr:hypothetical protein [Solirubrobacterales bacterium]
MSEHFPFVALEFGHGLGPEAGRYLVAAEDDAGHDVLQLRVIGAPPPKEGLVFRRAHRLDPSTPPRETSVVVATLIGAANRFASGREAERFIQGLKDDEERSTMLVDQAVAVLNTAVRAYRAGARDPYVAEITAADAREVRIGHGTAGALAEGTFSTAFRPPPPRVGRVSRAERLRPTETVAAALGGRLQILGAEDLALRVVLDLEQRRPRAAALGLRACLDLLVAELTDAEPAFEPPRDALLEREAAVERLAQLALADRLDEDAMAELAEHLDRIEDALEDWRSWHAGQLADPLQDEDPGAPSGQVVDRELP